MFGRDVGGITPSPGGKGDRAAVDEERRPLEITEPSIFSEFVQMLYHNSNRKGKFQVSPFLIRPFGAPSPRGKVFSQTITIQTPIYLCDFSSQMISRSPFSTVISAASPVKWLLTPRGKAGVRWPFSRG